MPLPVAHTLFGASLLTAAHPKPLTGRLFPLFFAAFLSIAPDFDFALVILTGDMSWHRGFSHSILAALFVAWMLFAVLGRKRRREVLAYSLAFASHAFLDFVTTRHGSGLELFFPFSAERFRLGLLGLSEMPGQFSPAGLIYVVVLEFLIFSPLLMWLVWRRKSALHID